MADTYTETSTTSWFSRIKSAFAGMFFGLLLIIGGIVLLFWNEGRTVKNKRALKEGEKNVISVPIANVNNANEGKLIHFTGLADTKDTLADDEFGISEVAVKLSRKVEMYQWEEKEESTTKKKLGGSEETKTTYKYSKTWSGSLINSGDFKVSENHENPAEFPYSSSDVYASNIRIGAFELPASLIQSIPGDTPLPLTKLGVDSIKGASVHNSTIYIGKGSVTSPKIGDVKITFSVIKPQNVSVVGKQTGSSVEPYVAKNGKTVFLLQSGTIAADKMFQSQISSNKKIGWLLRLVGFLLVFGGFGAIFKPLSVIADVVPFIGNIVAFGTGLVSGILAFAISFIVIAVAWIYYRPVVGISLLAVAVFAIVYVFVIGAGKKKAA